MLENGTKVKILWLQPARFPELLFARDMNHNNLFFIYAKRNMVKAFPPDGLIGEFDDFQDTCVKLSAAKFFDEKNAKDQLKNIDLMKNKGSEKPEIVELGKILISEDLVSNNIGKIYINNRSHEVFCEIMDAGEYKDKTNFDVELR